MISLKTLILEEKPATAQTKLGTIQLQYLDNYEERGLNKEWTCDIVKAFLNGQELGYLKISYIPNERMERLFPDPVHYMAHLGGWVGLDDALETGDKKKIALSISRYVDINLNNQESSGQLKDKDSKWWDEKCNALMADVNSTKRYFRQWRILKYHNGDCPLVDYIRITRDEHKRNGIGVALYIAGGKWMAEKGMCLHASSLQSEEAIAAWQYMKKLGLPVRAYKNKAGENRVCLDYR